MSDDNATDTQVAEAPADVEKSAPVETPENETETTEDAVEAEGEEPEAEPEQEPKPKRESGYDRMKRKNQYLQSEILRLQSASREAPAETDKPPREEDFNGDWGKFIAATAAYEAAKAVKDTLTADKKSDRESKLAELRSEVLADFEERSESFKAKAADFDTVIEKFVSSGGKFSDVVRELVTESDVGPQLAYHLAKNPTIATKLNSLAPLQAAKEIARLEDTLSRPQSKTTKAPAPLRALNGGSAAPSGEDAQVDAMLKKLYG